MSKLTYPYGQQTCPYGQGWSNLSKQLGGSLEQDCKSSSLITKISWEHLLREVSRLDKTNRTTIK